jgi:hypothetical protein
MEIRDQFGSPRRVPAPRTDQAIPDCLAVLPFSVLGLRLPIDGDVGISALPKVKEILVGLARGGDITHHFLGPRQPQL